MFGIRRTMRADLADAVTGWRQPGVRLAIRTNALEGACATFFFLTAAAVLAWMVSDALDRAMPSARSSWPSCCRPPAIRRTVRPVGHHQLHPHRSHHRPVSLAARLRPAGPRHRNGTSSPPTRLEGGIRLEHLTFRYPDADTPPSATSACTCQPGLSSHSSARTAPARPPWSNSSPACTDPHRAGSWWTTPTSPRSTSTHGEPAPPERSRTTPSSSSSHRRQSVSVTSPHPRPARGPRRPPQRRK